MCHYTATKEYINRTSPSHPKPQEENNKPTSSRSQSQNSLSSNFHPSIIPNKQTNNQPTNHTPKPQLGVYHHHEASAHRPADPPSRRSGLLRSLRPSRDVLRRRSHQGRRQDRVRRRHRARRRPILPSPGPSRLDRRRSDSPSGRAGPRLRRLRPPLRRQLRSEQGQGLPQRRLNKSRPSIYLPPAFHAYVLPTYLPSRGGLARDLGLFSLYPSCTRTHAHAHAHVCTIKLGCGNGGDIQGFQEKRVGCVQGPSLARLRGGEGTLCELIPGLCIPYTYIATSTSFDIFTTGRNTLSIYPYCDIL